MKKAVTAFLISAVINATGMLINYMLYVQTGKLLFARRTWGGECMNENGFGLNVFHVYPMTPDEHTYVRLSLDLPGLLVSLLAIAAIAYVLIMIISRIRKPKERI